MQGTCVRIASVTIEGLKNVEYGRLSLTNARKPEGASVLGLYGQNGSGKSALIDAIGLLKACLSGEEIGQRYVRDVSAGTGKATLRYELEVRVPGQQARHRVEYGVTINGQGREESPAAGGRQVSPGAVIAGEKLSIAWDDRVATPRMRLFADTFSADAFEPKLKFASLIGKDRNAQVGLLVEKRVAYREGRSFIFSPALASSLRTSEDEGSTNSTQDADKLRTILACLTAYGRFELFVLGSQEIGIVSIGALPLPFSVTSQDSRVSGRVTLPMDESAVIPETLYRTVRKAIVGMDVVLRQIVPGLTVDLRELGEELMDGGERGRRVQLVSVRGDVVLPLRSESDGIKRIISFLHLLILMYNDPSVTVAIDEIDSGVFEYLLGELLSIISERGKGQLIFTSHNLRPLETIDRGYVAFTTTNPANRYTRMAYVKPRNNLRDFYYRDITLGGQKERLYEETNNSEIALALLEAGEADED